MPGFLDPHDPRYQDPRYHLPKGVEHFYSDESGLLRDYAEGWYYHAPELIGPFPSFDKMVADYHEHFSPDGEF